MDSGALDSGLSPGALPVQQRQGCDQPQHIAEQPSRPAADAMTASGMADYDYQYVNIDDFWMVRVGSQDAPQDGEPRDAADAIQPNRRFPEMWALTDNIHGIGLKAGLSRRPAHKPVRDTLERTNTRRSMRASSPSGLRFSEVRRVFLDWRRRGQWVGFSSALTAISILGDGQPPRRLSGPADSDNQVGARLLILRSTHSFAPGVQTRIGAIPP